MRYRWRLLFALVSVCLLAGCGGSDDAANDETTAAPTTTVPSTTATTTSTTAATTTSVPGIDGADSTARAVRFSESFWGSWPDVEGALEAFADDVVFYDPADGDFVIAGKDVLVPMLRGFVEYYATVDPVVEQVFVSGGAAAYRVSLGHGFWPPWSVEPVDHPRIIELAEVHFVGDAVTGYDVWFEDDTLGTTGFGCFAANGCPDLATVVDRYVATWTSGDPGHIAALYDENATFTDSFLQIDAVGLEEISGIATARFGQGDVTLEVVEIYAQTNGPDVPTDTNSEVGEVIAVGLHYGFPRRPQISRASRA